MSRNLLGTGVLDDSTSLLLCWSKAVVQHEQSWGPAHTYGPIGSCSHVPVPASFVTAVLNCGFGVTLLHHMFACEIFAEQDAC